MAQEELKAASINSSSQSPPCVLACSVQQTINDVVVLRPLRLLLNYQCPQVLSNTVQLRKQLLASYVPVLS